MFKYQSLVFGAVLALVFLLSGCFGGSSPERAYFSVDYPLVTQKRYEQAKYPKSVLVQHFTTILAYDRQEIVYRANPFEFKYYWYRLWASKPRKMLQELFAKHLRYTGIFQSVTLIVEDRVPDYSIEVEIIAIEELDVTDTEWYAHLAMRIRLIRFSDAKTVWNHEFDAKKAVAENRPVYVVKAMSEVMDNELTKAFDLMDAAIQRDIVRNGNPGGGTGAGNESPALETLEGQELDSESVVQEAEETEEAEAVESEESEEVEGVQRERPKATLREKR